MSNNINPDPYADQDVYADDLPDTLPCYQCKPVNGIVERRVLGEGPVVDRADPTQTYRLECGHLAI